MIRDPTHALMAGLLYGSGLRLMECIRLRVQDIDFDYKQLVVRDGKGQKDRIVPLPEKYHHSLQKHLAATRTIHNEDLKLGHGAVYLPAALLKKYPNADRDWRWQYVFPSGRLSVDPRTGATRRHHLHENTLQRSVGKAAKAARKGPANSAI